MSPSICPHCHTPLSREARFCSQCGAAAPLRRVADLPLPERLGSALGENYSVLGELGRGGFAVVFSVRDQRLNRYLAVKVMRPEFLSAPTAAERFRREAQMVAQLDHPNILPISFAGEGAGLSYFAMPRIQGETLQRRLERDEPFEVEAVRRIFKALGEGLGYAHARGVVHRDVKPANVMLDRAGKPLLLDFGIAKSLSLDGSSLSVTGAVIGTPQYMAPEQAAGGAQIDARADVYGLGVLGYEMLAGRLPFPGDPIRSTTAKRLAEHAPDVRAFRPETPADLAGAIDRCLLRDPAGRWPTGAEAAAAV